jgi:hypothetical protein
MKKLFACALLICMSMFAVPAASAHGSLVINKHNPDHYGWAVDQRSEHEADEVALSHCTGHCEVVYRFEHTCAAFASEPKADGATGWAHDEDLSTAKEKAVHECRKYGGEGCAVRVWGCDK